MWTIGGLRPGDESFLVLLGERRKELLNQLQALPSGFKLWQALPLDFSVPIPVSGRCSDKQSHLKASHSNEEGRLGG